MVDHPGDPKVKVQVGWIIQMLEMLDAMLKQENPNVNAIRRELKYLLHGVMSQWSAEKEERQIKQHKSTEELLKEFDW